ncbi:MAG: serine hydrolase domain-containing protein, partial [Planctomycetota bacterium]|nr:serine hydrolase domain-containing protein [Planctomycetota bacterium]
MSIFGLMISLSLVFDGVAPSVEAETPRGDLTSRLDAIRTQADLPALGIAAIEDGDVVLLEAVGVRSREDPAVVTVDDRWHLGSCGKALAATVVARLIARGTLEWTTTVGDVFGGEIAGLDPAWRDATIAQLLRHRGGLPEDRAPDPATFAALRTSTESLPEQRATLMRGLLVRPPAYPPGTEMAYSNFGYVMVSAMAERLTGEDWETLCRRLLFEPLGMETAGFGAPGRIEVVDQPRGHLGDAAIPPSPLADNPACLTAAGTVHASLKDWARFLRIHLTSTQDADRRILGGAERRELHRPEPGAAYAAGWVVGSRPWAGSAPDRPGRILMHNGSNGMWFAVAWLAPDQDRAFMAVTNRGGPEAARACDQAVGLMLELLAKPGPENRPIGDDEDPSPRIVDDGTRPG